MRIVLDIVAKSAARLVVKGKSMASEEIHLNDALEAEGVTVVETDLGEFIIQLAHETPSHIIVPAIHRNRFDVAQLFSADAGYAIAPVVEDEAAYARQRLRDAFLAADVGITGVNFAVAETGSICLVENEGNGRMCSSLPRVHIAVMGMERIVRDWDELDVMLALLARSATGQALSVYTNIISGPRREGELDGPEELHVVVLDNGRSNLIGTAYEETLSCIRCGACLNVCPVYRHVGGHAYRSVYSGPDRRGAHSVARARRCRCGRASTRRRCAAPAPTCARCASRCTIFCCAFVNAPAIDPRLRPLVARVWSSSIAYRVSVRASRVALRLGRVLPKFGWAKAWSNGRRLPGVSRR